MKYSLTIASCFLVSLLPLALASGVRAGDELPVLRTRSAAIDIQDCGDVIKEGWIVDPQNQLDIYYAQRADGERTVTFSSDIDSISINVTNGQTYDFVIRLEDGRDCRTRISTLHTPARTNHGVGSAVQESIPFTLGRDGRIHIIGRINGVGPLDLIFDTGADTIVVYPSAIDRGVRLSLDGTVLNAGTGGTTLRQTSSDNRLEIAGLIWDHESLLKIERQVDRADGIVGGNVFEDRAVTIDYDRSILTVEDRADERPGFVEARAEFRGVIPFIELKLNLGTKSCTEMFLVDTGSTGSLNLSSTLATRHELYDSLKAVGTSRSSGVGGSFVQNEIVLVPGVMLGGFALRSVPAHREIAGSQQHAAGALSAWMCSSGSTPCWTIGRTRSVSGPAGSSMRRIDAARIGRCWPSSPRAPRRPSGSPSSYEGASAAREGITPRSSSARSAAARAAGPHRRASRTG